MLTVVQRPDAYLYQNNPPEYGEDPYYYSRWSAAHLPLVYKISTDKSPINTFDEIDSFTQVFSTKGYATFDLTGTYQTYVIGSKVKVTSDIYDSVYEVKDVVSGEYIVLDVLFIDTITGTLVKFFDNYQVLVKLYAGIAEGHPLEADDPMTYIGTFAIAPNPSNIAIIDVADLVRQKIKQDCDISGTGRPNDLNAWSSFYIEYAETYDDYAGSIPYTYTSDYETDLLDGCTNISITNGEFASNLDGWTQGNPVYIGAYAIAFVWNAGKAKCSPSTFNIGNWSKVIYQPLDLIAGKVFQIQIDWGWTLGGTLSRYLGTISVYATNDPSAYIENDLIYRKENGTTFSEIINLKFTTNTPKSYLAIKFLFPLSTALSTMFINSVMVNMIGSEDCKAYIYAHNGTRQFFDLVKNQRTIYGGNMAEYVMNYNTQEVLGKFLTRFETPTIFAGKYFDLSCIIPKETLDIPSIGDGVYYRVINDGINTDTLIQNNWDGVYRLKLDDKVSSEKATVQLLRKQTPLIWSSIFIALAGQDAYSGENQLYGILDFAVGFEAKDGKMCGINEAIITTTDGFDTKVYLYKNNLVSLLGTVTLYNGDMVAAFDSGNWIVCVNGDSAFVLISKNNLITKEAIGETLNIRAVAGTSINDVYILVQNLFSGDCKIYKRIDGSVPFWQHIYSFGFEAVYLDAKRLMHVNQDYIYVVYTQGFVGYINKINKSDPSIYSSYLLASGIGVSVHAFNDQKVVACTTTDLFTFDGTTVTFDSSFDFYRLSVSDSSNLRCCFYDSENTITVCSGNRLYQKIDGAWQDGANGEYTTNLVIDQYDSRYENIEELFLISEKKDIKLDSTCAKQSVYLSWINSLGNWEYFLFTARKTYEKTVENVTTTRRNIYASFPDNFTSETEQDKIRIEAYDKVTVRSQFVTKDQLDIIAEIITSIRVQAWYSSTEKITVIVDSKKVTKYSDGDKLYAIEFDIIYPMNQTISQ